MYLTTYLQPVICGVFLWRGHAQNELIIFKSEYLAKFLENARVLLEFTTPTLDREGKVHLYIQWAACLCFRDHV